MEIALIVLKIIVFFIGFALAAYNMLQGLINKIPGRIKRAIVIWIAAMLIELIFAGVEYIAAINK